MFVRIFILVPKFCGFYGGIARIQPRDENCIFKAAAMTNKLLRAEEASDLLNVEAPRVGCEDIIFCAFGGFYNQCFWLHIVIGVNCLVYFIFLFRPGRTGCPMRPQVVVVNETCQRGLNRHEMFPVEQRRHCRSSLWLCCSFSFFVSLFCLCAPGFLVFTSVEASTERN
jgi:hypothetical protein